MSDTNIFELFSEKTDVPTTNAQIWPILLRCDLEKYHILKMF